MDRRVTVAWRLASRDQAKQAQAELVDAGHEARSKGRNVIVGHHPEAKDGVTALVRNIDPDAERQEP